MTLFLEIAEFSYDTQYSIRRSLHAKNLLYPSRLFDKTATFDRPADRRTDTHRATASTAPAQRRAGKKKTSRAAWTRIQSSYSRAEDPVTWPEISTAQRDVEREALASGRRRRHRDVTSGGRSRGHVQLELVEPLQPTRLGPHLRQLSVGKRERLDYETIRYDTRCHFNVRSKADVSQFNLPHGTDNKKV